MQSWLPQAFDEEITGNYIGCVARQTVSTKEAAYLIGVDPRLFAKWARERRMEPLRRQRIGRSFVTVWSVADLQEAATRPAA